MALISEKISTQSLATKNTNTKVPYLWVSDVLAAQPLATAFPHIFSLSIRPESIPVGHHILCFDFDTPEIAWRAIAYELLALGCKVDVYEPGIFNRQPLEWYLNDGGGVTAIAPDIVMNAYPYEDWEDSQDSKLSLKQALKLAELVLIKISDRIQANIALEALRRRAGVSDYNWDKKYLDPIRAKLECVLALPDAPTDPSERKRLELKALAQERDPYKITDKLIEFCRRTGWTRRDAEQQIRLFKTSTITPKAKRLKGKDFLALETESISWVFPGIIPSRGVFVVGGHAGAGKTTLAYDAVGSLLLGEEFLGEKPVKAGKVLIVTGDELPCFTQDKLIDRGIPLDNDDWDIILNWDVSQWDVLEEAIADIRPTLVVIDSFSSIHRDPRFDENSSQAKSTIYDLEALTNAYGCGCILIHHLSKSKENQGVAKLRGSSAISAAASVVCLMESTSSGTRKLSFPKVRGAQTEPILVALDSSTGRYEVVSGGDNAGTKSLGDRILAFLQKTPYKRFEQEEISEALGIPTTNKDSVYQALSRLFKRGLITKRPSKIGGKRKVYGVANPSQLAQSEGLRNVTDMFEDTPPPSHLNVSVQISESIAIDELELTDTLTDTLTNTKLTPQNDESTVSCQDLDLPSVSAKLTNIDSQGEREGSDSLSGTETVTPPDEEEAGILELIEILNGADKALVREIRCTTGITPSMLNQACKRLAPAKRTEIRQWVQELNQDNEDLNSGKAVGRFAHTRNMRGEISSKAWQIAKWCERNGFYTLENEETFYPFQLILTE